jgi:hypothetical protein
MSLSTLKNSSNQRSGLATKEQAMKEITVLGLELDTWAILIGAAAIGLNLCGVFN